MISQQQNWLRMWQHSVRMKRSCYCKATDESKSRGNTHFATKLQQAESIIKRANSLYGPEELMLCFNGGKDCTVLLDVLTKHRDALKPLRAVCFKSFDPFEEVEQFIDICTQRYSMDLRRYDGVLKLAIEQALAEQPQVRAVFLGCRRSDPGCAELSELTPCDRDWPPLMRIFPLLEWSYHDIWDYLRSQQLPYCSLYDQGYTSLGERSNTRTNPSLLVYDKQLGKLIYRPAYELSNDKLERANREDSQILQLQQHNT
ncbi:FAD synthase [Drosophila novamexicana]|uniref:FAD synthase n=1 Tax=Drosophila novamexicana TaxID=47314 RepID=UPI0011E5BD35|nr:FAD synthase [Drosophila novamexicana]